MDKLVQMLFKWTKLREALFTEVNFYNSISRMTKDPEAMQTASTFWDEGDGWRGWTKGENKYYFNDIPEYDLMRVIESIDDMEKHSNSSQL